jgi:hypothetical protein
MSYEQNPEWLSAKAEYIAAKTVAEAASDEMAQLRNENAWLVKSTALKERLVGEEQQAQRREKVLAQVKEDYPLVPESVYQHIADPDALLAVAKDMQETMDKNVQKSLNRWGPSGAPTTSTGSRKSQPAYLNPELREKVNANAPGANKAWKDDFWNSLVMPFVERERNR